MRESKSKFSFINVGRYIIKQSSLRNSFMTDNKYSMLYWTIVLFGTSALAVLLSYGIVLKWYKSPVSRFMVNEPRKLAENPFPAITICLQDSIDSDTMNLASVLSWDRQNKTDEEWQTLNVVYSMCFWKHKILKLEKIDPEIVYKVLKEFSVKCEDTIKQIRWKDHFIDQPCKIMQPTFVLNSLCFSFNALPYRDLFRQTSFKLQETLEIGEEWSNLHSNWNLDDGYSKSHTTNIPWNIKSTGFWSSVEFILAQKDSFYGCSSKHGFTVYFHNPSDVPDYSQSSIKFSNSSHSLVLISSHISLTDDSIKSWTPKKRGCYYSNEKWLKYNKIYSYRNCYVECQVNNTERFCGCSPISRINDSLPVCGPKLEKCVANAVGRAYDTCKCLPSCTDFDYELAYSVVPKNFSYIKNSLTFLNDSMNSDNLASIEVMVNSEHTWPLTRNAEDTNIGYIGQIAGITNLCRGVSVISILETLYFLLINPFFH